MTTDDRPHTLLKCAALGARSSFQLRRAALNIFRKVPDGRLR